MIDLDRFKEINDGLGHAVGDELLVQIADRLRAQLRPSDLCARIGGDEFAIIQMDGSATTANEIAGRIVAALEAPFEIGQAQIEAGASIGIALAPEHGAVASDLMKRADLALYRSKSLGRRCHVLYGEELGTAAGVKWRTEGELRQAIENRQFEVHYQPIFDMRSGNPAAAEALVRWRHPTAGVIFPDAFISLAEETGLISAIGEQVLAIACEEASRWPEHIGLCVNISPKQLNGAGIVDAVSKALAGSGLAAERLELEITETAVLGQTAEHLPTLRKLKALGVSISLDDFGTGYSSLSQLTSFVSTKSRSIVHSRKNSRPPVRTRPSSSQCRHWLRPWAFQPPQRVWRPKSNCVC